MIAEPGLDTLVAVLWEQTIGPGHDAGHIVLAHDLDGRRFVGVGLGEADRFAFIHTDEITAQELERRPRWPPELLH